MEAQSENSAARRHETAYRQAEEVKSFSQGFGTFVAQEVCRKKAPIEMCRLQPRSALESWRLFP